MSRAWLLALALATTAACKVAGVVASDQGAAMLDLTVPGSILGASCSAADVTAACAPAAKTACYGCWPLQGLGYCVDACHVGSGECGDPKQWSCETTSGDAGALYESVAYGGSCDGFDGICVYVGSFD